SFTEPQAHYADVEMIIDGYKKDYIDVKMPVWTPGSYLIREFAKNVEGFQASDRSGNQIASSKINKNTWRVSAGKKDRIRVNYRVYAFEISVRTPFVDASHAFLSPTGVFMYVDGQLKKPATVTIEPFKGWDKVSTGLEEVKGKAFTYRAPDFDILFDSPIEVGNQDVFEFEASGVRHEVAMYGGGNYQKERLKKDMAAVIEQGTAVFGENPNKKYVFIVHNFNGGGGGLEHLNSTVLGASRNGYANPRSYKGFLSLVAHEYFHLWNVKRLRPVALGPFDYDVENYTTNLWIAEGFTAYYDNNLVRRAGFYSPEQYLEMVAGEFNSIQNQPGSRVQSASEASFDAWIKQYRPNENSRNTTISYYNKGAVIATLMDLEIMHATNGAKTLDDVMKSMYDQYYKKAGRGYTDAEFKAMVEKVSGKSFDKFYADYVYGTSEVDHNQYLGYAGLRIMDENAGKEVPYLGIATSTREGRLLITSVSRGSGAWNGGLNVNDELLAVNGEQIRGDVERSMASRKVGEKLTFTVVRDGLVKEIPVTLTRSTAVKYRIVPLDSATPAQLAVRKKWLHL
ncbi:MAG TPA: PDZ domain-containing protein, partial [Sphingobacteriaceae bacterium]